MVLIVMLYEWVIKRYRVSINHSAFIKTIQTNDMNTKYIRRNLYKVLRKTGVPRDRIMEDATFSNDMLMDEIDMTCFLFYLETSFKLSIDNEALPRIISVRSTIDFLKQRCA